MEDLKKKRDELQKKYERMMDAHTKKAHISSEGAHMDSANAIKAIYAEIFEISEKIGDPVPVWF
mgnify:FL=1|jgi:hypothetical protein|tara:strand:+ start:3754 stop:3945 length:192 start_codon:yes stop_codon:yes gene_type:complete